MCMFVHVHIAAGEAYCCAARLHRDRLDTKHEAANHFAEAAAVLKKVKPEGRLHPYPPPFSLSLSLPHQFHTTIILMLHCLTSQRQCPVIRLLLKSTLIW